MNPRYPLPELTDLPDDIRQRILDVQAKAGFVPNVFLMLARRPAEWRAFFAYHDALMMPETVGRASNLTKGEREMIVVATSAANQCLYCVVAHGAILRIYEKKPLIADQVAVNYRKADISRAPARHSGLRHEGLPAITRHRRRRLRSAARARPGRRGHLGHRGHHRPLRSVEPHGVLQRHAAQRRVFICLAACPRSSDPLGQPLAQRSGQRHRALRRKVHPHHRRAPIGIDGIAAIRAQQLVEHVERALT
jgi:AhpD family alkylhydroperoxidase